MYWTNHLLVIYFPEIESLD